jgi:Rac GTPase-activating protein 1
MFLHQYELIKQDHQRMIEEAQDLQRRLDDQTQQAISIERKLNYARKLLETERKARRDAENDKAQLEQKLDSLRTLLIKDNTIKNETRRHLEELGTFTKKRKSAHYIEEEEELNEIDSTGSFLSDLSLTQSNDDILDAKPSTAINQKWKKHRPSINNNSGFLNASGRKSHTDKRRSARLSLMDYGGADKIVTQTKLTIPANKFAPIFAEATIERALPTPSASSEDGNTPKVVHYLSTPQTRQKPNEFKTPMRTPATQVKNSKFVTPSAPSIDDLENANDLYATVKKKATTTVICGRPHSFASKTFLKPESCGYCSKKIRFGSAALKCNECRTCIHQDCREKFTIGCLPQNATPTTNKHGVMGQLSDYVPNLSPMVPALIVHCVNEIETRGLNEVGLYRLSGNDRDVKGLKERFLRNNGIPNLQEIDIHVRLYQGLPS